MELVGGAMGYPCSLVCWD